MMNHRNLQGQYSGFLSRTTAFLIDGSILTFTVLMTYWLSSQLLLFFVRIRIGQCAPIEGFDLFTIACNASTWLLEAFIFGFPPLYILFFWSLAGQTPGKRLMGIRVVRLNGQRMNLFTSVRRLLGYPACFLSLGIGFLWVLIDDRRQGWHDKIAGTCVVYSWEARQDDQFLARIARRINRPGSPEANHSGS